MKGVILAGGSGSRLDPFTKVMNKHLLPVGRYPMIYWTIKKLSNAGIKDIMIVTNKEHIGSFKSMLGNGDILNVSLQYEVQKKDGGGAADALLCSCRFVQNEKFVVLLGDNIFEDSLVSFVNEYKKQSSGARVFLKKVKDPERYGVAVLNQDGSQIESIHEKPQCALSPYCVTGIYMYDSLVFNYIKKLRPSDRNELEITDVNKMYLANSRLYFDILEGWWVDAGTHESLFQANQLVNGMTDWEADL
ncbi:sugar phosphate nucleotidyltransferase [Metabacillus sp. cB07]|uniref:sugar phosphate nucleotidyltransferase n=1 Tax=Metabacillus sp. cB07 TaxID=2806989 RepID=UPI0019395689|nr:sugar phosphate nucleotidyltransferase [Metabacillus sp. cB07]